MFRVTGDSRIFTSREREIEKKKKNAQSEDETTRGPKPRAIRELLKLKRRIDSLLLREHFQLRARRQLFSFRTAIDFK